MANVECDSTISTVSCYNKGCGKNFKPKENKEDSCQFHPGIPVFHDALKGWSCCKKRSTDFTEFLNIQGCTKGFHSNEKPPEVVKQQENDLKNVDVIVVEQEKPRAPLRKAEDRPCMDEPRKRLPVTVGATLKQALEKKLKEMKVTEESSEPDTSQTQLGTACKNKGCTSVYEGDKRENETCIFHPGVPIFHEGLKFWSCCQRKTSDFNNFLSQEGCERGCHLWKQDEETQKKVDSCRYDWHQTTSMVIISVFSKVAVPEKTYIEVNKVSCVINIVFEGGKNLFRKEIIFQGIIDPEKSSVKLLGAKVEINLKKGEPGSWSSLALPQKEESL